VCFEAVEMGWKGVWCLRRKKAEADLGAAPFSQELSQPQSAVKFSLSSPSLRSSLSLRLSWCTPPTAVRAFRSVLFASAES
jgi:hypothetical protein